MRKFFRFSLGWPERSRKELPGQLQVHQAQVCFECYWVTAINRRKRCERCGSALAVLPLSDIVEGKRPALSGILSNARLRVVERKREAK